MLHAIIMAGGSGTRFWPASRQRLPKQLLDITGSGTMLAATVDRLRALLPPERIVLLTNEALVAASAELLPAIPRKNILGEPCKRDTGPCIGLAAALLVRADADATMAVMPADHVIGPPEEFQNAIRLAADLVEEDHRRLITFGIRPTYPSESFGYVERGEPLSSQSATDRARPVFNVARFREKPKIEVARAYCESGRFYWNSGIFVWKACTILDQLELHCPQMRRQVELIAQAEGTGAYVDVLRREFSAIRPISIDYAVMEKADNVAVVEARFTWDDVGSWQSLARLRGTDADGNTVVGRHLGMNTTGSIVRGDDDHLVVTLGLRDCLIVHTPDATLVANKHDEEAIREVVKRIEQAGWSEYL